MRWCCTKKYLTIRPLDRDSRRNIQGHPSGIAQHCHDLDSLAGPINTTIQPHKCIDRTGMRYPLDTAIGQVEGREIQVERSEIVLCAKRMNCGGRLRTFTQQ